MSWTSFIAWRYFNSKKKDKFVNLATMISVITSTLAIAFLVISFSIFRGYKETLIQKLTKHSGHIVITDSDPFEFKDILPHLTNVKHEFVVQGYGLISSGTTSTSTFLYASSSFSIKNIDSHHVPIIVSKSLADQMHYKPTDIITIIVPVTAPAPFFLLPENLTCEIVKIQKFDSEELNDNGIIMNLTDLQNILNIGSHIHKIKCFSKNFKDIDRDFHQLNSAFPKKFVLHWKEINEFFLKIMKSEQNVFMLLLIMLSILASLLYILAIGMFINSKVRDIKTLKILGASSLDISSIFLRYSIILASINIIIGIILGLLISLNINRLVHLLEKIFKITLFADDIYLINYIPTSISFLDLLFILLFSFFISFFSSFWISRKMSSIDIFGNL